MIDEFATVGSTQPDAETRFHAFAKNGAVKRGLKLLGKLDRRFNLR